MLAVISTERFRTSAGGGGLHSLSSRMGASGEGPRQVEGTRTRGPSQVDLRSKNLDCCLSRLAFFELLPPVFSVPF